MVNNENRLAIGKTNEGVLIRMLDRNWAQPAMFNLISALWYNWPIGIFQACFKMVNNKKSPVPWTGLFAVCNKLFLNNKFLRIACGWFHKISAGRQVRQIGFFGVLQSINPAAEYVHYIDVGRAAEIDRAAGGIGIKRQWVASGAR